MIFLPKVEKLEQPVGSLACPFLEKAEFEEGRIGSSVWEGQG
jgi:hypothetical protein